MTTTYDAARDYLRQGFAPIPVPHGAKGPKLPGWQKLRLTADDLAQHFNGHAQNIGLLNGAPSGDLVDVDLDAPEARHFHPWLPATGLIAGRAGSPASHRFYRTPGLATAQYRDPDTGDGRAMLVELRSTGTQTLVPPSIHPSGEPYRWECEGEPASVAASALRQAVGKVAAGVLLARHWPPPGSRHDASLALAGWLLRNGWEEQEAADFIDAVARTAGDEEHAARGKNVASTAHRLVSGGQATGAPKLAGLLTGNGRATLDRVGEWLELTRVGGWPDIPDEGDAAGSGASQHEWAPPIPLATTTLPSFPTDVLPPALRHYVAALAVATQTPPDLAGMLVLAALATASAGKVVVTPREGWVEPVNLFGATVLASGNRKSAVFRAVVAPIEAWERAELARVAKDNAAARSARRIKEGALKKAEREAVDAQEAREREAATRKAERLAQELAEMPEPVDPQLIADDATPETVKTLLAEQGGRLALLSAEGTVFELMAGRYSANGAPNLEVYLQGHAGDPIRVDRRNRHEHIDHPALTIGVAVQPDVLRAFSDKPAFRGRGLTARFLYALPESYVGRRASAPPPVPDAVRADYDTALMALLDLPLPPAPRSLVFDGHASARFVAFQDAIEPQLGDFERLEDMKDWGSKLPGAVARIAGLLHLAAHAGEARPWDEPIDLATLEAAIAIGEYAIPHALAAANMMGLDLGEADARYLLRWVARHGGASFAKQEVWQGTRGRFGKGERLDRAIERLIEHRYLRALPTQGRPGPGRRPAPVYEVTPYPLPTIPSIPTIAPPTGTDGDCRDPRDCREADRDDDDGWGEV